MLYRLNLFLPDNIHHIHHYNCIYHIYLMVSFRQNTLHMYFQFCIPCNQEGMVYIIYPCLKKNYLYTFYTYFFGHIRNNLLGIFHIFLYLYHSMKKDSNMNILVQCLMLNLLHKYHTNWTNNIPYIYRYIFCIKNHLCHNNISICIFYKNFYSKFHILYSLPNILNIFPHDLTHNLHCMSCINYRDNKHNYPFNIWQLTHPQHNFLFLPQYIDYYHCILHIDLSYILCTLYYFYQDKIHPYKFCIL